MCWESATVYQHTSRKTDAQHVVPARACTVTMDCRIPSQLTLLGQK